MTSVSLQEHGSTATMILWSQLGSYNLFLISHCSRTPATTSRHSSSLCQRYHPRIVIKRIHSEVLQLDRKRVPCKGHWRSQILSRRSCKQVAKWVSIALPVPISSKSTTLGKHGESKACSNIDGAEGRPSRWLVGARRFHMHALLGNSRVAPLHDLDLTWPSIA